MVQPLVRILANANILIYPDLHYFGAKFSCLEVNLRSNSFHFGMNNSLFMQ